MSVESKAPCYVGVDVGGTFTDVVLGCADGRIETCKVATTPDDPRQGVTSGIEQLLSSAQVPPGDVARVVHGTTLATNVILERRGGPVVFVTTAGFGDMLRLGREARVEEERFNLWFTTPEPPVRHRDTLEVVERIGPTGAVVQALGPEALEAVVHQVASRAPDAVAICFLNSYANPTHELLVAEALRAAMPKTYVVASSEIWPEMREYERATTTVMCAYVGPVMSEYLAGLESQLRSIGIAAPVEVMESSGGVMSAALAAQRPVHTVESGGAAGVIAAGFVGSRLGYSEVVSFDMGGTTAKIGIIRNGQPSVTHDFHVGGHSSTGGARSGSGFPVKIPVIDLAEVGAGGGSIAWVDDGGALRVGPRSSGSVPGPACYGRGGLDPTVTDANLLLGYLRGGDLSGGVSLDRDLSEEAFQRVICVPLGLDLLEAAQAVHEIANASMAAAIRVVTILRGIDPRHYTMVAFGGAGPLHATGLAETFEMERVVVPWAAGVASAVGLITADLVVERVMTRVLPGHQVTAEVLDDLFGELERRAGDELPGSGDPTVTRSIDVRYVGQAHQLRVALPSSGFGDDAVATVVSGFLEVYERAYGVRVDAPVEVVNLRVRLVRPAPKLPTPESHSGRLRQARTVVSERLVYDPLERTRRSVPVVEWSSLEPGEEFRGPVLVEGPDTTAVVSAAYQVRADPQRNLVLTRVADV